MASAATSASVLIRRSPPRNGPVPSRDGGLDRARPEERAATGSTALMSIERLGDLRVQWIGRGELDPTDDRDGQQRGAIGIDAGHYQSLDLRGGQHVQQRGGGDQSGT